jgi:replicative DNA helicase
MDNLNNGYSMQSILEAEASVLGAILLNSKAMDSVADILHQDDFYVQAYQWIWRAMIYLYKKDSPIDVVTLSSTLNQYKKLEDAGGMEYITQLSESCPSAMNIKHYADIVKRESARRKGVRLAEDIIRLTKEDEFETPDEYFMMMESLFNHMRPDTSGRMRGFDETKEDYMESLTTTTDTIKTGFEMFDNWSGGIGRGWLYILAGRPSIGKTAKSLQMAVNIAKQHIGQVLFWSQEMTFNQLKNRMLAPVTEINYSRIRRKELEPHEIKLLSKAHDEIGRYPLFVEDSAGVTIEHITATARRIYRKNGQIGAIFVDYLTRMNIKQEKGQTWSRAVGDVAKRFKWLAQELNCPVFLLAQLNREGADKEPSMQNLRDSGEIEQEADVIEFLWRDSEEDESDGIIVRSTIAKGRDIGVGKFRYLFKGWIQKYEDYKEVQHESMASVQSYQEDGSTYRKIPNKQGNRSRFSKRNA